MRETIRQKINRFYRVLSHSTAGGPNSRYRSWEYCHLAFLKYHKIYYSSKEKEKIIDYLCLHLSFYLASWGMYRGSSYLLQRDYFAHKKAVELILDKKYEILWDYNPTKQNIDQAYNLLFDEKEGIYWKIKESYSYIDLDNKDTPTDTLTTKILMGTFACIPSFDRYLKSGIKIFNTFLPKEQKKKFKLSNIIESKGEKSANIKYKRIIQFAIHNKNKLKINSKIYYPPMKCVDMYFWQIGYEYDLLKTIRKSSGTKREKAIKKAADIKLCNENDSSFVACRKIESIY